MTPETTQTFASSNPPGRRWRLVLCGGLLLSLVALIHNWYRVQHTRPDRQVDSGAVQDPADAHTRMVEKLAAIAARMNDENPYLGDRSVRELQSQVSNRPAESPVDELRQQALLAFHRLRIGQTDAAIAGLQPAVDRMLTIGVPAENPEFDAILMTLITAFLRRGENVNCVNCMTSESCLFPITVGGRHREPQSSREALRYLEILLERSPGHLGARWLLNVAAMTVGDYPDKVAPELLIPPESLQADVESPRFVNRAADLGLNVMSLSGGVIVDDFDGDHWFDVVFSDCHPRGQLRFFRNLRNGQFEEQTEAFGLTGICGGLNLVQADYDNDGFLDILVLRGAWLGEQGRQPNSLLKNLQGRGFRDVTFDVGLGESAFPTQTAAWADIDLDGDLDLYVGNELYPSQLFENQGDGSFRDIGAEAGVTNGGFTKGVSWGDFDDDGDPDLYVSNLDGPNRLYRNDRDAGWTDVAAQLNVVEPRQSFGCWFWDVDNDGHLDLTVLSYAAGIEDLAADYLGLPTEAPADRLYRNDGQARFVDRQSSRGWKRVTHPMGANFGDINHDGYLDVYLGTGDIPYQTLMPALMLLNRPDGPFADISASAGLGHLQKGHGIAFADLDHDGDQDIVFELGGAFAGDRFANAVFENPGTENHSISLKLIGQTANRCAIGARIWLTVTEDGRERQIIRWVNSGGSFGANPLTQQIGLGPATQVNRIRVRWPGETSEQVFEGIGADRLYEIRQGDPQIRAFEIEPARLGGASQGSTRTD